MSCKPTPPRLRHQALVRAAATRPLSRYELNELRRLRRHALALLAAVPPVRPREVIP